MCSLQAKNERVKNESNSLCQCESKAQIWAGLVYRRDSTRQQIIEQRVGMDCTRLLLHAYCNQRRER